MLLNAQRELIIWQYSIYDKKKVMFCKHKIAMCAHQYNECYEWSSCFDHLIEINWAADISSNKASSFLAVSLIHNLETIY